MAFPETKFGICPRCGRGGIEVATDESTSAGTGYELHEYDGEDYCRLCIIELDDDKALEIFNTEIREEEKFRQRAGVIKI